MRRDIGGLEGAGTTPDGDDSATTPVAKRVGDPRGRAIDRGVVVALAISLFVGVAVVKPWGRDEPTTGPDVTSERDATTERDDPTADVARPASTPSTAESSDATRMLRSHYEWGVMALLERDPDEPRSASRAPFREVWLPARRDGPLWWPTDARAPVTDVLVLPTEGSDVVALGVTSPPDEPLLDVRIWRMTEGETRLAVRRQEGVPGSAILLLPPSRLGAPLRWEPDVYRLDVLTGREVRRITVIVRGEATPVAPMPVPHQYATGSLLAASIGAHPRLVVLRSSPDADRPATADLRDAEPTASLDEAAAWLALPRGEQGSVVHEFAGPSPGRAIVGIGVGLAAGSRLRSASLLQYGTDVRAMEPVAVDEVGSGGPTALFQEVPRGFAPGSYRIDLTWWDVQGIAASGSYHLELRADGATPIAPPLLRAARRHAGVGADWAVLGGVLPTAPVLTRATRPSTGELGPTCDGGAMAPGDSKVLGVRYPGTPAGRIEVARLFVRGRSVALGATVAAETVDGLALLAPREAGSWPWGFYAVTIHQGERRRVLPFCVGRPTTEGLRVPDATADLDAYFFVLGHAFFDP